MLSEFDTVGNGDGSLRVEADDVEASIELVSDGAKAGIAASTGAAFGDVRGDTLDTGRDSLEPPDVLAMVLGPPAARPGLDAREEGADSGDNLFIAADGTALGCGLAASLSDAEPSEAELAESETTLPFAAKFTLLYARS